MDSGFEGMYEDGVREQGSTQGGGEAPRPHAQCHLLSPTDKCKVIRLMTTNDIFEGQKNIKLFFVRFAMSRPPNMFTTVP